MNNVWAPSDEPWELKYDAFAGEGRIIGHDERGDLTIAHVNMGFASESLQATALMTSAPALYEALKGAKELIDHIFSGKRVDWGRTFDIDWGMMNKNMCRVDQTMRDVRAKVGDL